MREWLSGGAPPCQGGGRGFDPRLALLFLRIFRNGDRVSAPLRSALNACHWHAAPLAGSVSTPLRSALNGRHWHAAVSAPLRSVLNACHWHAAPSRASFFCFFLFFISYNFPNSPIVNDDQLDICYNINNQTTALQSLKEQTMPTHNHSNDGGKSHEDIETISGSHCIFVHDRCRLPLYDICCSCRI